MAGRSRQHLELICSNGVRLDQLKLFDRVSDRVVHWMRARELARGGLENRSYVRGLLESEFAVDQYLGAAACLRSRVLAIELRPDLLSLIQNAGRNDVAVKATRACISTDWGWEDLLNKAYRHRDSQPIFFQVLTETIDLHPVRYGSRVRSLLSPDCQGFGEKQSTVFALLQRLNRGASHFSNDLEQGMMNQELNSTFRSRAIHTRSQVGTYGFSLLCSFARIADARHEPNEQVRHAALVAMGRAPIYLAHFAGFCIHNAQLNEPVSELREQAKRSKVKVLVHDPRPYTGAQL